jgi:hypothetical protein
MGRDKPCPYKKLAAVPEFRVPKVRKAVFRQSRKWESRWARVAFF